MYAILRSRSSPPGTLPPKARRDCFGRDELIEKAVDLACSFRTITLIGAGGIGKTHIALAILHNGRIKKRFGENRRFIHCNRFLASPARFLAQLSMVIGAGVENPEDLVPLRPFFYSNEMFIVIDEVESILDPKQPDAPQLYSVLEELCRFEKLSICLTSRITTVPTACETLEIPTLSKEAACDLFYSIYNNNNKSRIIDDLVGRLDFHPLSITLLAITASHNTWDYNELAKEWNRQQVQLLQTGGSKCLSTTIESSLASPTFQSLGPYAHDLLSIVAFFPQGINEKHSTQLIPLIPGSRRSILDGFVRLSLTDRRRGFITMLAPIRGYLNSKCLQPSPLLCRTIESYIIKLLDDIRFNQKKWILLENLNIQHLLDELICIYPDSNKIWYTCSHFIKYLASHGPQKILLWFKIKDLPNDHQFKQRCLDQLSELSEKLNHRRGECLLLEAAAGSNREKALDDDGETEGTVFSEGEEGKVSCLCWL